jgi:hypothetical protein
MRDSSVLFLHPPEGRSRHFALFPSATDVNTYACEVGAGGHARHRIRE